MTGRLLTTRQVAELLGVSHETVLRYWRAGELGGYRLRSNVLRFSEGDVAAFLAARRRGILAAGGGAPLAAVPSRPSHRHEEEGDDAG